MQKNKALKSVYIHIPFCKKICSYCDFCKNYYDEKKVNDYLNALENEIKNNYNNEVISTIYVGGGTPSCLSIDQLNKLFSILEVIKKNDNYEFTFECNYDDITIDKLRLLKKNEVNRISIGVQTFNEKYEKVLNRSINKKEIINKVNLTKKYFSNINLDLMYALPNETINDLKNDLKEFIKLDVKHISTYSLIVEKHTKLYIENLKEIDEDLQYRMYELINKELTKNEYNQYEISNYAKKDYESKHNLTYWNNEEYYGFGLGASGFVNNIRYDNTKSINNYIKGNININEETLSKEKLIEDEIMLNLRKTGGINKDLFKKKYKVTFNEIYDISDIIDKGYLKENKNNIYIPFKYLFVSNEIIIKILESKRII